MIVVDVKEGDVVADLSDPEGRRAAIEGVRALAPDGLDGFVPCAGVGSHIKPASLIAQVNYFAVIETIEGLRDLVAKRRGSVLLVSSNSAPMLANDNPFVAACVAGRGRGGGAGKGDRRAHRPTPAQSAPLPCGCAPRWWSTPPTACA